MIRRQFLATVLALGGSSWLRRSTVAAEVAAACGTGRHLVDELEAVARLLGARWDSGNPAALQRQLLGFYSVVGHLAENATPLYRVDLQQITGRTAALLGLVSRFVGQDNRALNYLLAADTWALEAGDDHLRALAATWRSDIDSAVQAGRPGPSDAFVRQELDSAERLAGDAAPSAVRALLLLRQAEEHAAAGEIVEASRYLDRADAAWAVPGGQDEGLYGIGWSETIHRAFRANVAVLSGRPADALPILVRVVEESSGSNRIAAATDLAAALARLDEVEESAEVLIGAWAAATTTGLADRVRRVRGVRARDLVGFADVPAVRRLDEAMGDA